MTGIVLVLCLLFTMTSCASENIETEILRWTKIGALGSWAGSLFGALALVIALVALYRPQKVKMKVSITSSVATVIDEGIWLYTITVKNSGIKPFTVKNFYLHFGDKCQGDVFIGLLNRGTIIESINQGFPVHVDQGESFDYHLCKERLDFDLMNLAKENNIPYEAPLSLVVDGVINGRKYFSTSFSLKTFIGNVN